MYSGENQEIDSRVHALKGRKLFFMGEGEQKERGGGEEIISRSDGGQKEIAQRKEAKVGRSVGCYADALLRREDVNALGRTRVYIRVRTCTYVHMYVHGARGTRRRSRVIRCGSKSQNKNKSATAKRITHKISGSWLRAIARFEYGNPGSCILRQSPP